MYFLLTMVIFHCYVSLPEGISRDNTETEKRFGPPKPFRLFECLGYVLKTPFVFQNCGDGHHEILATFTGNMYLFRLRLGFEVGPFKS